MGRRSQGSASRLDSRVMRCQGRRVVVPATGDAVRWAKAELIRPGLAAELAHATACSAKGLWRISHTPGVRMALNKAYFDALGLPRLDPCVRVWVY